MQINKLHPKSPCPCGLGKPVKECHGRIAPEPEPNQPTRLTSRPQIRTEFGGQKVRAVGNKIYFTPKEKSFHDFEVDHLLWQLGKDWFDAEMAKPLEERHIILQWRHERAEQFRKHQKPVGKTTPHDFIKLINSDESSFAWHISSAIRQ